MDYSKINNIIEKHKGKVGELIAILEDIQSEYNYIDSKVMELISEKLRTSLNHIYGIATFYNAFSLEPRGKNIIHVCLGTACHVRGGIRVLEQFETEIGIKSGKTTSDMQFTLEGVNCLGACALGPIAVVNGQYHGNMDTTKVKPLIKELRYNKQKL